MIKSELITYKFVYFFSFISKINVYTVIISHNNPMHTRKQFQKDVHILKLRLAEFER